MTLLYPVEGEQMKPLRLEAKAGVPPSGSLRQRPGLKASLSRPREPRQRPGGEALL